MLYGLLKREGDFPFILGCAFLARGNDNPLTARAARGLRGPLKQQVSTQVIIGRAQCAILSELLLARRVRSFGCYTGSTGVRTWICAIISAGIATDKAAEVAFGIHVSRTPPEAATAVVAMVHVTRAADIYSCRYSCAAGVFRAQRWAAVTRFHFKGISCGSSERYCRDGNQSSRDQLTHGKPPLKSLCDCR